MKIWTTYYHNVQYIKEGMSPIAISRTVPDFYEGRRLFELAPTRGLFSIGKSSNDKTEYIQGYKDIILAKLDPHVIANVIGHNGVIMCYEARDKFCHRHLVAEWLSEAGYDVSEYVPGGEGRYEFNLKPYDRSRT